LAREIKPVGHLTVITAAVPVTSILSQDTNVDVIQLGGITRSSSVSVVGPFAEQMLGNFNCSKLFVGVDGIDLEFGLTTTNMLEAALNRVMMNAAQKVIVLADSSKFGRRGFSKICDLEAVDRIITDNGIQPLYLDRLRERGIEVIVVDA
ncbi:DeoR/GlpR family DNA-binding transcription regulator, partial [Alistipes putredinis]